MKKRISLYLIIASLFFVSCEEWLVVNPNDQYTAETFWSSAVNAKSGLMGCYNALYPWQFLCSLEFEMLSGNAVAYNEANGTKELGRGQALSTCPLVESVWKNCYTGIGRTNLLIDKIDDVPDLSDKDKAAYKAEAKFLRAFFYYNLVDKFGGVPLITEAPDAASQEALPRNSKEECLTQIYKDLDEAIPNLPKSYNAANAGRITQGAAQALKARILLYNEKWAEAANMAKAVIDSKTYSLFKDYRHFWFESNKHNSEVIFEVEHNEPDHTINYDGQIYELNRPAPLQGLVDAYLCTDGKTIEESPLYDPENPYHNRDPRLLKTIAAQGTMYNGVSVKMGTNVNTLLTGYSCKKYTTFNDETASPITTRTTINIILIRYAEVLLTYAEAKNEASGPDASVYDALNQLRTRPDINMPTIPEGLTKEQLREVIRLERRIELAMEGLYYTDARRWKTIETENNATLYRCDGQLVEKRSFNKDRDYLWPIPYNQILQNPNLSQNPNWD